MSTVFMAPGHPDWDLFLERLAGPEGVNVRGQGEHARWTCDGSLDRPATVRVLKTFGFSDADVFASLDYFQNHGGYCDCEVLINVDDR